MPELIPQKSILKRMASEIPLRVDSLKNQSFCFLNRFKKKSLLRLFSFISILLTSFSTVLAIDGSFYVGESFYIENPYTQGSIDAIAWYSDHQNDIYIKEGTGGATCVIAHYFSGIATIECQYGYTYYIGSKRQHGTGHQYYKITCKSSTATLSNSELTLAPGETATLTYSNSSGYKIPDPYYKTDDKTVATVDDKEWSDQQSVKIKGERSGTCTITFYPKNGGDNPTCKVTVLEIPATDLKLSPERLYLRVGKKSSFSAKFTPSNASSTITWSSDNEYVAKIRSTSGAIEAISEGTATITATTDNGLKASATVEVVPAPTAVSLPEEINVTLGFSTKVVPTLTPSNSTASYYWKTEDKNIATVDGAGNIKGISLGTTKITVKTDNGMETTTTLKVIQPQENLDVHNVTVRVQDTKKLIDQTIKQINQ